MKTFLLTLLAALLMAFPAQAAVNQEVTVNVTTPGTLGDLILAQTENLIDVVTLHVGGTINDDDAKLIKNDLQHLRNLDMASLQLTIVPKEFMYDRDTLQTVVLPNVCNTVEEYAFAYCNNLTSVTLNSQLETIKRHAFHDCEVLDNVSFPASLRTIDECAFEYCYALSKAILPAGLTTLGNNAFYNCRTMKEVTIPSSLKKIPDGCFQYNYNLSTLTIPEGIEEIGNSAFYRAFWESESQSASKQIRLTMPSTLKVIGADAFGDNENIVEVTLNEGLETLGRACFEYCRLTEVTVPSTVRYARSPFYQNNTISRITCLPVVPPNNYETNFILGSSTDEVKATLVVPAVSMNEYKQTTGYTHYTAYEATTAALPTAITVGRDFRLQTVAGMPKMDITMLWDRNDGYYAYDGMGTLTVEGPDTVTLSVGQLSMIYDSREEEYYKWSRNDSSYDLWGTVPGQSDSYAKTATSLVVKAPMRADATYTDVHMDNNDWIFISFPYNVRVGDITGLNYDEYAVTQNDRQYITYFAVYRYDGAARAALNNSSTWVRLTDDDIMQAGQGYIIQATGWYTIPNYYSDGSDYTTSFDPWLRFPAKDDTEKNLVYQRSDAAIALAPHASELAHNINWNLVGNPYPCYVKGTALGFDGIVTIWNQYYQQYEYLNMADDPYVFSPFEAFFIQAPVGITNTTMAADGRQTTRKIIEPLEARAQVAANADRKVINLKMSNGNDGDRTRVVINPAAKMDYEIGRDAAKMESPNKNASALFSLQNGVQMAINERPLDEGLVSLGFTAASDGTYTIALSSDPGIDVELIDQQENRTVALNAEGYTFQAKAGTNSSRFMLRIGNGMVTNVQYVATGSQQTEQVFDLQGRRMGNGIQKGVYVKNGKKVVVK